MDIQQLVSQQVQSMERSQSEIYVIKRSGRKEKFSAEKVLKSIVKACHELCNDSEAQKIVEELEKEINNYESVTSYEIAERIERIFMELGIKEPKWFEVAKRYELGRIYKDVYGKNWDGSFNAKDLKLTFQAVKILSTRYLLRDAESGRFLETPQHMFRRVAKAIAEMEFQYCRARYEPYEKCIEFARMWLSLIHI